MGEIKTYTAEEVKKHNTEKSLWIIIEKKIYDLSTYLDEDEVLLYSIIIIYCFFVQGHPGGPEVLVEIAGEDGTEDFNDVGHSEEAHEKMKEFYIGDLVETLMYPYNIIILS